MTNIFESNKTILYINLTRTVMSTLQKISSRYMYMIFFYQSCVYLGSFFVLVFEPHWGDVITSPVKALKRYSNSFRSFTSRWCCRACNITNRDQCIVSPSIIHTKLRMQPGRINIHVKSSRRFYFLKRKKKTIKNLEIWVQHCAQCLINFFFCIPLKLMRVEVQSAVTNLKCVHHLQDCAQWGVQDIYVICQLRGAYSEKLWPRFWKCCPSRSEIRGQSFSLYGPTLSR